MSNVWQIGAGDFGRDYSWLFLRHDLMFLGPGRFGEYTPERYSEADVTDEFTNFRLRMVASFHRDVRPGDTILLRRGHRIAAMGLVPEDGYFHDATFDDLYGWDLEHARRVIWQEQLADDLCAVQAKDPLFSARKQIPTFTRVKDTAVLDPLRELIPRCTARPLKPRPSPLPPPLSLEELGRLLFAKGLANSEVDQVQRAIERQRRLLSWYRVYGRASSRPDEHEVVSHMVLPLLLALGWSEQLLAVEWHKVDLAGFWATPTTAENCALVCEAKGLWHGLQGVLEQAERYTRNLCLQECRKILVTQGGRFYLYDRNLDGTWPTEPSGYLNVERIRINHLAPANTDAVETLMALTPTGVHRP